MSDFIKNQDNKFTSKSSTLLEKKKKRVAKLKRERLLAASLIGGTVFIFNFIRGGGGASIPLTFFLTFASAGVIFLMYAAKIGGLAESTERVESTKITKYTDDQIREIYFGFPNIKDPRNPE